MLQAALVELVELAALAELVGLAGLLAGLEFEELLFVVICVHLFVSISVAPDSQVVDSA